MSCSTRSAQVGRAGLVSGLSILSGRLSYTSGIIFEQATQALDRVGQVSTPATALAMQAIEPIGSQAVRKRAAVTRLAAAGLAAGARLAGLAPLLAKVKFAAIYETVPETAVSARIGLMGWACTYLSALLCVATLQAPTARLTKMREILATYERLGLYEARLALFGLDCSTPELAQQLFQEGCEAFDLAVQIRRTPHRFQHKLHPHLRPYFVNKCRRLFDSGHPREALAWVMPFYLASCEVIMTDGAAAQQEFYAERLDRFLGLLGLDSIVTQQTKWAESRRLGEAFFSLADDIIDSHPDIVA